MSVPLSIHHWGAGVLWGIVGGWRDGWDELIKVKGLVQNSAVGRHAVSAQGSCSVWHELK